MTDSQSPSASKWASLFTLDSTTTISILDRMMQRGPHALPVKSRSWNYKGKGQAARGDDITQWLLDNGLEESKDDAKETALQLVYAQGLIPIQRVETAEKAFLSSPESYYAHYALSVAKSQGLNLFMYGKRKGEKRELFDILDELSQAFIPFLKDIVLREGKEVDYSKVRESDQWVRILELLIEVETASLDKVGDVPDEFKLACLCNLYNILIIHGKMVFGHPSDIIKRGPFFENCAYNICGTRLSSTELEQGLLRLKMKDEHPLSGLRVAEKDARIHFILNCGAKSCPPLMALNTKKDINTQLNTATTNFISENAKVDSSGGNSIALSRLWKWFRVDFTPEAADDDKALLTWICERAPKDMAEKISELLKTNKPKIQFNVYDWGDNGDPNSTDTKLMSLYDLSFKKNA